MSKHIRPRQLDVTKYMPIYTGHEVPDFKDHVGISRGSANMPTGMEKEEESELHLVQVLSAQQFYGSSDVVIPVPDINDVDSQENTSIYGPPNYRLDKTYVRIPAYGVEQELPDYDMDSEDEVWLSSRSSCAMELSPIQFERMMDRLEKNCGQTVLKDDEAKILLKDYDDELILSVYDYWLNKRLKCKSSLIPLVRTERPGTSANSAYIAFRRRAERKQTRQNRKNDEFSYEKMLKLKRDLQRARNGMDLIRRREKSKKELVQLTVEINEKRMQVNDWDGALYSTAQLEAVRFMKQRQQVTTVRGNANNFHKSDTKHNRSHDNWSLLQNGPFDEGTVQLARGARSHLSVGRRGEQTRSRRNRYNGRSVNMDSPGGDTSGTIALGGSLLNNQKLGESPITSDDEGSNSSLSPIRLPGVGCEEDADGQFAFRRMEGVLYQAAIAERLGNWPWCAQSDGGYGDVQYRFSLTSGLLPTKYCKCSHSQSSTVGMTLQNSSSSFAQSHYDRLRNRLESNSLPVDYPQLDETASSSSSSALSSLPNHCPMVYGRRRVGRGGLIVFDRAGSSSNCCCVCYQAIHNTPPSREDSVTPEPEKTDENDNSPLSQNPVRPSSPADSITLNPGTDLETLCRQKKICHFAPVVNNSIEDILHSRNSAKAKANAMRESENQSPSSLFCSANKSQDSTRNQSKSSSNPAIRVNGATKMPIKWARGDEHSVLPQQKSRIRHNSTIVSPNNCRTSTHLLSPVNHCSGSSVRASTSSSSRSKDAPSQQVHGPLHGASARTPASRSNLDSTPFTPSNGCHESDICTTLTDGDKSARSLRSGNNISPLKRVNNQSPLTLEVSDQVENSNCDYPPAKRPCREYTKIEPKNIDLTDIESMPVPNTNTTNRIRSTRRTGHTNDPSSSILNVNEIRSGIT